jgi:hypothetical protein
VGEEIHRDPALRAIPGVVCLDTAGLRQHLARYRLPDDGIFLRRLDALTVSC